MDGVLQRCNIRLSNYVSNIECKSYRDVVRRLSEGVTNPNELMKLVHGRIVNRHGAETILASLTGVVSQAEIDVLRPLHEEIDIAESHRNECYISKCKGDMRLYLRRKGKLPCFSYLVRGKSFSFYRGKIHIFCGKTKPELVKVWALL